MIAGDFPDDFDQVFLLFIKMLGILIKFLLAFCLMIVLFQGSHVDRLKCLHGLLNGENCFFHGFNRR